MCHTADVIGTVPVGLPEYDEGTDRVRAVARLTPSRVAVR
jgi:hypothetical protein